jgi:hypothetical protein
MERAVQHKLRDKFAVDPRLRCRRSRSPSFGLRLQSCGGSWGRIVRTRQSRRRRIRRLSSRLRSRCGAGGGRKPGGSPGIRARRWRRSPTQTRWFGIADGVDTVDADPWPPRFTATARPPRSGSPTPAARSDAVTKKHNALARRLLDRQHDYLRFTTDWRVPADNGSERDIRMINSGRRYPAACAPSPEPNSFARYAATSPPPPSTANTSSPPSSCSPRDAPGSPQFRDLTSYVIGCRSTCHLSADLPECSGEE